MRCRWISAPQFGGEPRFLEIAVKTSGAPSYTLLSPRQPLTPATHALGLVLPYATVFDAPNTGLSLQNYGDGDVISAFPNGAAVGGLHHDRVVHGRRYLFVGR